MKITEEKTDGLTTQRIEAFSDGVFAIAITLLILELRVPHASEGGSLAHALWSLGPSYFAYVLSFVMIGIYWANHHYLFKLYKRADHVFNLLNVLFLMCISFLPFPTAVLGQHLDDPYEKQTAVMLYAFGLFLPAFSWLLIWLYGSYRYRLIDVRLDPKFVSRLTRQYALSNGFYLLAFLIAFMNATLSLVICVGLTLVYLLPPPKPAYRKI